MPEWATAVLSAAIATVVSLTIAGVSSHIASRRRVRAQLDLAKRKMDRIVRRDIAIIDEYFGDGRPEASSRLKDCGVGVDDLVVFTEDLDSSLSEALAEYQDRLAQFKRDPYMVFDDEDPKHSAHPTVEAANRARETVGLPPVALAPFRLPEPGPG